MKFSDMLTTDRGSNRIVTKERDSKGRVTVDKEHRQAGHKDRDSAV
jgi:hypothetical protein